MRSMGRKLLVSDQKRGLEVLNILTSIISSSSRTRSVVWCEAQGSIVQWLEPGLWHQTAEVELMYYLRDNWPAA